MNILILLREMEMLERRVATISDSRERSPPDERLL